MVTDPDTRVPGTPLKLSRLLIAVLIVAALASILASLIFSSMLFLTSPGEDFGAGIIGVMYIGAVAILVSFPFVLGGLLLVALPLTVLLVRRGVAARARNLILVAVAAAIAALLWVVLNEPFNGGGAVFAIYAMVAAILWVLALRRMERRALPS